jgi:hypothetical protein
MRAGGGKVRMLSSLFNFSVFWKSKFGTCKDPVVSCESSSDEDAEPLIKRVFKPNLRFQTSTVSKLEFCKTTKAFVSFHPLIQSQCLTLKEIFQLFDFVKILFASTEKNRENLHKKKVN